MKIALLRMPTTYSNWYKIPSIGLGYLAAIARKLGHDARVFDAYYHDWQKDRLISEVLEFTPQLVGFTAMTHEINQADIISRELKQSIDIQTLLGGPHITALPMQTMQEFSSFDFGIFGEGEKVFTSFLQNYDNEKFCSVDGLIYRNGSITMNKNSEILSEDELDSLPFPYLEDYKYFDSESFSGNNPYSIFTSRGCPFSCVFCQKVLGNKLRSRSASNIYNEIIFAIRHYGTKLFDFTDEIFLKNDPNTIALLNMIIENEETSKIKWGGLIHVNFVTDELISLAKKAGCNRLEMGIESGSEQILKEIGKGFNIEKAVRAVKIIQKHNIELSTYFLLGLPQETKEDIEKTCKLAVTLNTSSIAVGIVTPYPGTKIYEMAKGNISGYKLIAKSWSDFDKYLGKSLEFENFNYEQLFKIQKKTFLELYLKNHRYIDAIKFFWVRRKAILKSLFG